MRTAQVARGLNHTRKLLLYHHLFTFLLWKILVSNWNTSTFGKKEIFQPACYASLATRATTHHCVNNHPNHRPLVQDNLYGDACSLLRKFVELLLNRGMQHQSCCSITVCRIKMVVKSLSRKYVQSKPIF